MADKPTKNPNQPVAENKPATPLGDSATKPATSAATAPAATPAPLNPPSDLYAGGNAPGFVGAAETVEIRIPSREETDQHLYWIGLTKDCPIDQAGVAGATFMKASFAPGRNAAGVEEASLRNDGILCRLSDVEKREVLARIALKGVRVESRGRRAHLSALEFDCTPLAWFAWMVRVQDGFRPLADYHKLPPTLAARPANARIPALDMSSPVTAETRASVGLHVMADDNAPSRGYSDVSRADAVPVLGNNGVGV